MIKMHVSFWGNHSVSLYLTIRVSFSKLVEINIVFHSLWFQIR